MSMNESGNVYGIDGSRFDPSGGGGNNGGMEARIAALEKDVAIIKSAMATKDDLAREMGSTRTETANLRADMHKEFTTQTWRIILAAGALVTAAYFIARNISP